MDAAKVATRIELLSHHIVACRALQIILPHLADAILTHAKDQQQQQQQGHENNDKDASKVSAKEET